MTAETGEQKPRVMIVINSIEVGGGAEKVASMLGNSFFDADYETHLFTFYKAEHEHDFRGIRAPYGESPKSQLQKIIGVFGRVRALRKYIEENEIEVAYAFLEESNFYTLFVKLCFKRKLRVIVSVRNNLRRRTLVFRLVSKLLYPHAHKVVAVTRAIEQILIDDLGLTNTTTIYNPLDMDTIESKKNEPLPAEYRWLTERSPLCISIGRLTHQKGQWHLIRAFSAVVETHPSATLVIIGDGEYRERLQNLIETSGLSENIYLIGKHQNVYQFLNAADLFVFSSLWEGMPNTMLEALAVGLPIVSTDCVSGPREIIAPELSVDEDINYPHTTPYGALVHPLEDEECLKPASEIPLTQYEKQLADAIVRSLETEHADVSEDRRAAFAYNAVMKEWEELI